MKIIEFYKMSQKPVLSLEIFPPRASYPVETIFETIEELRDLKMDFISVTYGAGGSTRDRTVDIASSIKKDYGIETLAHLTCMAHSRQEVDSILEILWDRGIRNIMALRGDLPLDEEGIDSIKREYHYAFELIEDARKKADFGIAAAAYPEGHPECEKLKEDLLYLKQKVDAGVDVLVTQFFFDNRKFYDFIDRGLQIGINCPIVPGIMPVLNAKQIKRMLALSGASIPPALLQLLDKYDTRPDDMEKAGIEYASRQVEDLIKNKVPGIHLYTMNKSRQIKEIAANAGLK
ncbi:MAG: methylenetetrahydrofolate reductase [NAD(P)H] [Syntrophomonadaceae bacterium]|jgi:methylenetetrahydrofolate reductase (NADPH)|nr:methylenetetrahydrofolate reductase [NAD(P)H] [Syntrophomonadaceae bacterium]